MSKKKRTNTKYKEFLANAYAWLSTICFALVIFEPLWHFNHDTISASIYVCIGWFAAVASTKVNK